MVLKILGYSQEKAEEENNLKLNPFEDVPEWFKGYAGLGVDLNLTKGKTETKFDPDSNLSKQEFIAFILRALDYENNLAYKDAEKIGKEIKLLDSDDDIKSKITKAEAADYIFKSLSLEIENGTGYTLGEYLVKTDVLSEDKAKEVGIKFGEKDSKSVNILYFNDFHGNVAEETSGKKRNMGMAKLAGYVDMYKDKHENTIVLSGGDSYQGTADSNLTEGKPVSEMMKNMGVVASAVGNHEFDWGAEKIPTWAKDGNLEFLATNIYDKETNKPVEWASPYKIIEIGGIKVGLIGLAHPETTTLTKAEYIKDFDFKDPVESAKEWVEYLQEGKAKEGKPDVIIALTHLDSQEENGEITGSAAELAKKVEGLDAVLSAHSHQTVKGKVNEVPILQTNYSGRYVGELTIDLEAENTISTNLYAGDTIKNKIIPDEATNKVYEELQRELEPIKNNVIGEATEEFTHDRDTKGFNTLLGSWSCEVMADKTKAQVAIQNGGGLRRSLEKGQITVGDMYEIMPFDNYLVVMDLAGSELIKAIDHGIDMPKTTDGVFSGLIVEYDSTKAYGEKITKMTLSDGTPIEEDKTYRVVVNDFMFTGGDGYDFSKATNVDETYIPVRDVLVERIKSDKTITPKAIDYITDVSEAVMDKAA
ncbi:multifunctional 2',3'-cyclic-nucleotide 2'-phosphodiesterase/5'-nucleotidase/3'-nucleotidase [Anaerosphaera multitolerans]|uniref:Multifunctional 2',3'-cyclic-nucleotide 2'-phosphodiesterase/5'-nucleotidase/3'-nucleotidase n=2 Tax=Anaerosphaera multitolerans TaxID=2487351 RepID=A0A437S548_9FIRM|nr:multifunctional 2',3'-cyclic-nucleotide 2'-phosphodiesterase/5'-nucleotidase/3'-nucleotidase [Anaerosphaera multitolerans]